MKKTILSFLVAATILSSCSDNGQQATTTDAQEVETVETTETVTFATVKEGSHLDWRASHLGGVQPRFGDISLQSASFLVNNGVLTNAAVMVDMASLTVKSFPEGSKEQSDLTGHLKNDDFFKIATYPTAKFELTKLESAEGDYNSVVTGNLTILDATKSITFKANVTVSQSEVSIKSEDFAVNRTDWGLVYNVEGSEGVPADYLIANDIGFTIDVVVTK